MSNGLSSSEINEIVEQSRRDIEYGNVDRKPKKQNGVGFLRRGRRQSKRNHHATDE